MEEAGARHGEVQVNIRRSCSPRSSVVKQVQSDGILPRG